MQAVLPTSILVLLTASNMKILLLIVIIGLSFTGYAESGSSWIDTVKPPSMSREKAKDWLKAEKTRAETFFNGSYQSGPEWVYRPQAILSEFCPLVWAYKMECHDIVPVWRDGKPTDDPDDIKGYSFDMCILWKGISTRHGYTQVKVFYDPHLDEERGRFSKIDFVSSNATTYKDISNGTVKAVKEYGPYLITLF